MKYNLIFEEDDGEGYGPRLDEWKKESVVPREGDSVFLKKRGWMNITHVGFSVIEHKCRLVFILVKQ